MTTTARRQRRTLRRATLLLGLAVGASGCGAGASPSAGSTLPGGSAGTSGSSTGTPGTMNGGGGDGSITTVPGTTPGSAGSVGAGGFTGAGGTTGAAGSFGTTGSAGTSGAAGFGGTAGTSGGTIIPPGSTSNTCAVTYMRLYPDPTCSTPPCQYLSTPTLNLQSSGPSSVLRLNAAMPGYSGVPRWFWIITAPDGSSPGFTSVDPTTNATIEIKTEAPGSYTIQPLLLEGPPCVLGQFSVNVDPPPSPSFVFRATPPAASGLPTRELVVDAADVEASVHKLDLGAANTRDVMSLAPVDPRRFPLPSYVRVTSPAVSFDVEAYTGQGPLVANLAPELTYDVLVVPDGPWAPLLVSGTLDSLRNANALVVSPGIPVAGDARDAAGAPVAGVRVLLRQGARPSTLGVTATDGKFNLLTRDGTLGAVISPPLGAGLPEAHVAVKPGISLPFTAGSLKLRMQWAALPSGTLAVTVRGQNGAPLPGARVRAENSAEIPAVGTLHVTVDDMPELELGATGSARVDGVTDATGVVSLGRLPAGAYRITVAPPDGASLALTSADVTVPATGLSTAVTVGPLVTLGGTLTGADAPAGWRISAIDRGPLAPAAVPEVVVGTDGSFALQVSPNRPYELVVETVNDHLTRTFVLATGATAPSASASGNIPGALTWKGTVMGGDAIVAGTLVEVFCVSSSSAACLDPSVPVTQGLSQADGSLTLSLPNLLAP